MVKDLPKQAAAQARCTPRAALALGVEGGPQAQDCAVE